MLSICIPVYNYIIIDLVADLIDQCDSENILYEIIVLEDGSDQKYLKINSQYFSDKKNVRHIIFEKNEGRSIARNTLADSAKYDKLIFIDCDSGLPDKKYIKRYLANIQYDIVCGGTIYHKSQNVLNKTLRYNYGINREMIDAEKRKKNPNQSFTTNNFLISKKIFESIRFREFLKKYGHEDSLFGYELGKNSFIIHHINNPVIHEGLEDNHIFLKKTQDGITNLILIEKDASVDNEFTDNIKLIRTYKKLKKNNIIFITNFLFSCFSNIMYNHLLKSKSPSILIFDLYKIGYYNKQVKLEENNEK